MNKKSWRPQEGCQVIPFPIFALHCAALSCATAHGLARPATTHGVFRTANVDSQKYLIDQTERHFPVWNAFAWKHTSRSVRQTDFFCTSKPPPYDNIAVNQIVVVHQISSSASRQCRTVPKNASSTKTTRAPVWLEYCQSMLRSNQIQVREKH